MSKLLFSISYYCSQRDTMVSSYAIAENVQEAFDICPISGKEITVKRLCPIDEIHQSIPRPLAI